MRVLVLGGSGFVGRHVVAEALARGHDVESWSRRPDRANPPARCVTRAVDLLDPASLPRDAGAFDAAVLLAGPAVPARVGEREADAMRAIARHALEHLTRHAPGTRVVVASSAHVHAVPADGHAIGPDEPLAPQGAYGRAKLDVEDAARATSGALSVAIVRAFHQIGRDMPSGLLVPDVLAALARGDDPLRLRGTDAARDFLDVRDAARAWVDLCAAPLGASSTFVLASGRTHRVSELVRGLCRARGRAPALVVAPDAAPPLRGDPTALARATGWAPRIEFEDTLAWIGAARA